MNTIQTGTSAQVIIDVTELALTAYDHGVSLDTVLDAVARERDFTDARRDVVISEPYSGGGNVILATLRGPLTSLLEVCEGLAYSESDAAAIKAEIELV